MPEGLKTIGEGIATGLKDMFAGFGELLWGLVVELFDFLDGKVMDTPGFSALDFKGVSKEDRFTILSRTAEEQLAVLISRNAEQNFAKLASEDPKLIK